MLYEDRMEVVTPEGVTLEFTLAGLGSRFVAAFLDALLRGVALWAVWLLAAALEGVFGIWTVVFGTLATFFLLFVYDILFETLASGRTPGKRWTGLRVVRVGGGPVTFLASAVRNLLRLADLLPGTYLVGAVAVFVSSKNQRLGDMAAGTLVVRERTLAGAMPKGSASWTGWSAPPGRSEWEPAELRYAAWDVSTVTSEEVAAVRQFLARRDSLTPEARQKLALELANALRAKVVAPEERMSPEGFLEQLVAAKDERA